MRAQENEALRCRTIPKMRKGNRRKKNKSKRVITASDRHLTKSLDRLTASLTALGFAGVPSYHAYFRREEYERAVNVGVGMIVTANTTSAVIIPDGD